MPSLIFFISDQVTDAASQHVAQTGQNIRVDPLRIAGAPFIDHLKAASDGLGHLIAVQPLLCHPFGQMKMKRSVFLCRMD